MITRLFPPFCISIKNVVNRVTVKPIIKYCPIENHYQFNWTHRIKFCKRNLLTVVPSIGTEIMEVEAAAKEAEPPHMAGGVWLWLRDRGVCVQPYHAANCKYREKNPLPDDMHDSPRKGTKRDHNSPAAFAHAFRGDGAQADGESRSLSESDIRKRCSSSQEMCSPNCKDKVPTLTGHAKRGGIQAQQGRQDGDWVRCMLLLRSRPRHRKVIF